MSTENAQQSTSTNGGGTRPPALLTIPEAATLARAPESSVRHWIASGKLRAKRPGRRVLIARRDLAELLGVPVEDLV